MHRCQAKKHITDCEAFDCHFCDKHTSNEWHQYVYKIEMLYLNYSKESIHTYTWNKTEHWDIDTMLHWTQRGNGLTAVGTDMCDSFANSWLVKLKHGHRLLGDMLKVDTLVPFWQFVVVVTFYGAFGLLKADIIKSSKWCTINVCDLVIWHQKQLLGERTTVSLGEKHYFYFHGHNYNLCFHGQMDLQPHGLIMSN